MFLKERLPSTEKILPVYALLAFMAFAWTIVNFLWEFSSWVYYLSAGEIMVIFAYSMASALLDSLVLLGILLLAGAILPAAWLRDPFAVRGGTAALFGFGSMMTGVYRFTVDSFSFVPSMPIYIATGLGLTLAATWLSTRVRFWARGIAWLSDQLIVFLFILLPLAVLSVIVVAIRNLF